MQEQDSQVTKCGFAADLQQWLHEVPHHLQQGLLQIQHRFHRVVQHLQYIPVPSVMLAGAVVLGLLLMVAAVQSFKQRQVSKGQHHTLC